MTRGKKTDGEYRQLVCLAKGAARVKAIRHEAQKTVSAPFEGDPTYKGNLDVR